MRVSMRGLRISLMAGASALVLAGCVDTGNLDWDLRAGGGDTSEAARQATAAAPTADGNGILSYPDYQLATARRGETVTILARIADLSDQYGTGLIRLTAHQKFVILNVPADRADALADELQELGLQVRPSQFRRSAMACTGIEYCKLAISETKARTADLVTTLETRRPDWDLPLAIHVNGCPNSCARFQVADIGLKGVLATDDDGNQAEGFQVHLGGSLGERSGFGRTPRGLRLAATELPDYVDRVLGNFLTERQGDESFAEWTVRADEEALR